MRTDRSRISGPHSGWMSRLLRPPCPTRAHLTSHGVPTVQDPPDTLGSRRYDTSREAPRSSRRACAGHYRYGSHCRSCLLRSRRACCTRLSDPTRQDFLIHPFPDPLLASVQRISIFSCSLERGIGCTSLHPPPHIFGSIDPKRCSPGRFDMLGIEPGFPTLPSFGRAGHVSVC